MIFIKYFSEKYMLQYHLYYRKCLWYVLRSTKNSKYLRKKIQKKIYGSCMSLTQQEEEEVMETSTMEFDHLFSSEPPSTFVTPTITPIRKRILISNSGNLENFFDTN